MDVCRARGRGAAHCRRAAGRGPRSPGTRILIRLENTSAYALLFFGAIAGGFVPLPTSAQLTEHEVQFLLEDSGAEAIALGHDLGLRKVPAGVHVFDAEAIARMLREGPRAEYADTAADDPAFLIYTSGTTALPKGVLHAQRSAFGRRPMYQGWYGIGATTACCTPAPSTGHSRLALA